MDQVEETWGYPHTLTHGGLRAINQFAEAELGAMILRGGDTADACCFLTEARRSEINSAGTGEKDAAFPSQTASASAILDDQRRSSSTSTWAVSCSFWANKGFCTRGISCWFQHTGFATHDLHGKPIPWAAPTFRRGKKVN